MGKAVVATRVGGIPEIVDSGKDGLLVESQDSAALAEAMLSLAQDTAKASQLGARASEKIGEKFTLKRMIDRHESLYLSLWR